VDRTADWWLGELDDDYFRALENAVRDEWQAEPLRIREGGVSGIWSMYAFPVMLIFVN
jgi:hypothetical protein